jgi:hypothetical protein
MILDPLGQVVARSERRDNQEAIKHIPRVKEAFGKSMSV